MVVTRAYNFTFMQTISQLYGNHLIESGKNSEAGLIYSMGSHFAEALEVYKKIGYWQEAISMATHLKQSTSQIHELARSLAGKKYTS